VAGGGRAEWYPFPQVTEERLAELASRKPVSKSPKRADEGVRKIIEEFNAEVADKHFEKLPDYFVERQRGLIAELVKVREPLLEKLRTLVEILNEKAPGSEAAKSLAAMIAQTESGSSLMLEIVSLEPAGEDELIGKAALPPSILPMQKAPSEGEAVHATPENAAAFSRQVQASMEKLQQVKFLRVQDSWQIEMSALDAMEPLLPLLPMMIAQFDQLIEGIRSGSPEAISQQLSALESLFGAMSAAPSKPPGSSPDSPGKEPSEFEKATPPGDESNREP
jgi:hypothetical protein